VDGRYLLVSFGYTSCPDVCPTTLQAVHTVLERLGPGADQLVPIFITVDPARDTRERLGLFVGNFDARIRGISDPAAVADALRAFHARAEVRRDPSGSGYTVNHTAVLYVLDRDRRVVAALPEATTTLAESLYAAVSGRLQSDSAAQRQ
jgi:protein SCO1